MTMTLDQINQALRQLEDELPQMKKDLPDESDFWAIFSGHANHIAGNAGAEHYPMVRLRLKSILGSLPAGPSRTEGENHIP